MPKAATAGRGPMPAETKLELRVPVTFADETYASLTLRAPRAGQWEELDGLEGSPMEIGAIMRMAGVPERVVADLGARDFRAALRIVERYVQEPPLLTQIAPDDADTFTMPLRTSVALGEQTITELPLREPKAGELGAWEKLGGTKGDLAAVTKVTGHKPALIAKLDLRDLRAATGYLNRFFSDGPEDGDT